MTVKDCIERLISFNWTNCYLYGTYETSYELEDLLGDSTDHDLGKEAYLNANYDIMFVGEDGDDDTLYAYRTNTLTDKGREDFIDGFSRAMPYEYDYRQDILDGRPLCAPWEYILGDDYIVKWCNAYEMGEWWGYKHRDEWEKEYFRENGWKLAPYADY